ncbi:MAG TPA: glutamate synthase large subunit [Candidatus Omnitrophota bacterium]|nr:glutamate synthase large subunit [Candidatus Omnitrophota bacterium]
MEDANIRNTSGLPAGQGLYDPALEHDSCGVGFVCDIKGKTSHDIVSKGLEVLKRLAHRGAVGADPNTGDGAGILIQLPHEFFASACSFKLPKPGEYGAGLVFLPPDPAERKACKDAIERAIAEEGQVLLGWREVPVDNSGIGVTARETEPEIEQVFIGKGKGAGTQLELERKLYVIRKRAENMVRASQIEQKSCFYITNLSSRTINYKGLLMTHQVAQFFPDLKDPKMKSAIALVHSRYSTNTFPTWDLAQPFRFLAHNGEINTLRGNINWMAAKQGQLASAVFGDAIEDLKPVIVPGGSDSAAIDNAFELLLLSGRSLPHAMMMLIPNAWEQDKLMEAKLKDFYQYHACFMEPWDGPAAIAFTDGESIGAVLDRNGLRPARYIVTRDDMVVMASEVGVLDIAPEKIAISGRLEPGKMFFIDTKKGRIINDEEIKASISGHKPYGAWLKDNLLDLGDVPAGNKAPGKAALDVFTSMKAFGYSREDLKVIIGPMAETGKEPVGSMGNDTPLAVMSRTPQPLYYYFKQLFAQVTNPAIDPIREELVMSLVSFVGSQKNILDESPLHCHKIKVQEPVLTDEDLEKIKNIGEKGFKTKVIPTLFEIKDENNFITALDNVCAEAEKAIRDGYSFIILSDRGVNREKAALPALLACGAVHHHLVRKALRTQIGIVVESAEPREVHHFGVLFGYGADCINPYLAYEAVKYMVAGGELKLDEKTAIKNYRKAVEKGIFKILSKMGISTLQSYRGAQIFEALGLGPEIVDRCFAGTPSRIGGLNFRLLAKETIMRHKEAFPDHGEAAPVLRAGGVYQWKRDGEFHLLNPDSIAAIQDATRKEDYSKYQEFAKLINEQSANPTTLRGLLKFKKTTPVPIEEVEPAEQIFKRFATGAMSFGSISRGAHETLAIAMNRIGGRSNTGEGGEDPTRFAPLPNGDSKRSAIKQVASGRFGVTINYLTNADEIQIKIAQGAKPGEGGQLPGHKVSEIIAKTRYTTPGVTLISPPPHHDIYSIEDLAQLIFDLKNANPRARISVKLVSEVGVGTVAAGVAKGHADMILISGGDGGTGASPLSSIKHAGLPWELGLSETHQTLVLNDLRSRVRLQTDGQMRTGRDVAIAALLGAEEYGFCTVALVIMGCVMLRHCHLNNCSVGVATQDAMLEKRFSGRPEYIINYFHFVARELREIMARLGIRKMEEMIGRCDLLEVNKEMIPWKAEGLDFSKILYRPEVPKTVGTHCTMAQDHNIDKVLDRELIRLAGAAISSGQPVKGELKIKNDNRTCGAMLSGEVVKKYGEAGLPDDTIHFKFKGESGQSFGAFLAKGVTFELEGLCNDYIGKGISGGKLIVYPDKKSTYDSGENILIGNTTFYGAISGEAYIRGMAGERFCIRNSGLNGVVEGVGDHGCEYMTGGRIVILGRTGRNFGAGMSGGIVYVYNEDGKFKDRCNFEMIEFDYLGDRDREVIEGLLTKHVQYTGSPLAARILKDLDREIKNFTKVLPLEYKRILKQEELEKKLDLTEVADG